MQIENLKIFCDLADTKNFSRAAALNYISQSAVSQQLLQFEKEYKTQLINRSKGRFDLTEAGKLFYSMARDIILRYTRFKDELCSICASAARQINIGAIYSIGMYNLQPCLKKFMTHYPDVIVKVEYLNAEQIYNGVIRGSLDVGVVAESNHSMATFRTFPFKTEFLVFVCSALHPFANKKNIDIRRLQGEKFIAFAQKLATRSLIDGFFAKYDLVIHPVMEFDNIETIKRSVEINSGVSILPVCAIQAEIRGGTLKGIEFSNEHFARKTEIIVSRNKVPGEATQQFLKMFAG